MERGKIIHVINIIVFFILVIFFSFLTLGFGWGRGENPLSLLLSLILVLFYLIVCFFYIKAFSLKNLGNNWFKVSFILNLLSFFGSIFIFSIILFLSNRTVEKTLSSFIDWGTDPGLARLAIIVNIWMICWVIFIISMIIFLIGYYKIKNKK